MQKIKVPEKKAISSKNTLFYVLCPHLIPAMYISHVYLEKIKYKGEWVFQESLSQNLKK